MSYDAMKEAHDQERMLLDWAAEKDPDAVLGWIRGQLASGKFLVLPPAIYDQVIVLVTEKGWSQEEIGHLHKSENLRSA